MDLHHIGTLGHAQPIQPTIQPHHHGWSGQIVGHGDGHHANICADVHKEIAIGSHLHGDFNGGACVSVPGGQITNPHASFGIGWKF